MVNTILLCISMHLTILGTFYKWNHTVLVFHVWLISLRIMPSRFITVVTCIRISFFLQLKNIPLYVYDTFCLFIHPPMGIFTFWLLWILLLWTLMYRYLFGFLLLILLIFPDMELLDKMVIPCSNFGGTHHSVFRSGGLFYIPTSNAQGFRFLYILASTRCLLSVFVFIF